MRYVVICLAVLFLGGCYGPPAFQKYQRVHIKQLNTEGVIIDNECLNLHRDCRVYVVRYPDKLNVLHEQSFSKEEIDAIHQRRD